MMLALDFSHLDFNGESRLHTTSLSSCRSGDTDNKFLPAPNSRHIRGIVEGRVPCHTKISMPLNLPAGSLHSVHIPAILIRELSSPAGYCYKLREATGFSRNNPYRYLGDGALPSPCAQEKPTTTPSRWYCHKCQTGPYSITAQPSCPNVINGRQCDHAVCFYCAKD